MVLRLLDGLAALNVALERYTAGLMYGVGDSPPALSARPDYEPTVVNVIEPPPDGQSSPSCAIPLVSLGTVNVPDNLGPSEDGTPAAAASAPAADSAFNSWWEQGSGDTLVACLSHAVYQLTNQSCTPLEEHVPHRTREWYGLQPGCRRDDTPEAPKARFYANEHWVVKVYRIGEMGKSLQTSARIKHAADACRDASASSYYVHCAQIRWVRASGLVHAGIAYVCIVRRRLFCRVWPEFFLVRWYRQRAIRFDMAHNDWDCCKLGTPPDTSNYEMIGFKRAARFTYGEGPSETFIQRRIAASQNADLLCDCDERLRFAGESEVDKYFKDHWRDGRTGYGTCYDHAVFMAAPLCVYSQ